MTLDLTIPVPRQPVVDAAGMMTFPWYRYFQNAQQTNNAVISIPSGTLLGNDSGIQGSPQPIGVGNGLTLSNGILSANVSLGTVTSVGLRMPNEFNVGGSPITNSGAFSVSWAPESANTVFAGPSSGGSATPGFRLLAVADIPKNVIPDLAYTWMMT